MVVGFALMAVGLSSLINAESDTTGTISTFDPNSNIQSAVIASPEAQPTQTREPPAAIATVASVAIAPIRQPQRKAPDAIARVDVLAGVTTSGATSERQLRSPLQIPARFQIPAIGVDALVEVKGLDSNSVMETPSGPAVITWYDFSARPGDNGNAVFAGHLDYAGVGPAVLWRLGNLQPGDLIEVSDADGTTFQYQVATVQSHPAILDAAGIVASNGTPMITIITCSGDFDHVARAYDQRVVVTGILVEENGAKSSSRLSKAAKSSQTGNPVT